MQGATAPWERRARTGFLWVFNPSSERLIASQNVKSRLWWIHSDFLFQGLQGKAGAKGSKGEVVSKKKRKQTLAPETTFVIFYVVVFRVILANLGRRDPLESQVFLYVSDGSFCGGGWGYNGGHS